MTYIPESKSVKMIGRWLFTILARKNVTRVPLTDLLCILLSIVFINNKLWAEILWYDLLRVNGRWTDIWIRLRGDRLLAETSQRAPGTGQKYSSDKNWKLLNLSHKTRFDKLDLINFSRCSPVLRYQTTGKCQQLAN